MPKTIFIGSVCVLLLFTVPSPRILFFVPGVVFFLYGVSLFAFLFILSLSRRAFFLNLFGLVVSLSHRCHCLPVLAFNFMVPSAFIHVGPLR